MTRIGIHHRKGAYSSGWIEYCETKNIAYKIVDAYHTDIVKHLEDCNAFMWHHYQTDPKDALFAKQLLFSLEQSGKVVYPNTASTWSFDDKLGQKYLLEALGIPLIPSFAFYTKKDALDWASQYSFPAVFKLRGGAGGSNVRLVKSKSEAVGLISKAFGIGFRQYSPINSTKDAIYRWRGGKGSFVKVAKGVAHLAWPYQIEKAKGRERGYVYFQEFIPDCEYDIRVQFVGDRCYASKRAVRRNDFRASGGLYCDYDGSKIPLNAISLAFDIAKKLKMQTLALDLVPYNGSYLLAEMCYAFEIEAGECDFGYWDSNLVWHPGAINPCGWMVELVLESVRNQE